MERKERRRHPKRPLEQEGSALTTSGSKACFKDNNLLQQGKRRRKTFASEHDD